MVTNTTGVPIAGLELPAWMPVLALTGETHRWEPRRLSLRLFSAAARIVTTARRRHLRFARRWPWTNVITDALSRLEALLNPG
ncbi:transposase [Streptomyces sp. ISL-86]|nr:transposase [Streptomyces sp. ISL-86]